MKLRLPSADRPPSLRSYIIGAALILIAVLALRRDYQLEVFTDAEELVARCQDNHPVKAGRDRSVKRITVCGLRLHKNRRLLLSFPKAKDGDTIHIRSLAATSRGRPIVSLSSEKIEARALIRHHVELAIDPSDELEVRVVGDQPHIWIKGLGPDVQESDSLFLGVVWRLGEMAVVLVPFGLLLFLLYSDSNSSEPQPPKSLRIFAQAVPIIICSLTLSLAVMSEYNQHPDEFAHYSGAAFYLGNWRPPKPADARLNTAGYEAVCSSAGIYRGFSTSPIYPVAGKWTSLAKGLLPIRPAQLFRLINVLLLTTLSLCLGYHSLRSRRVLLFALTLSCVPQTWYLFAYLNDDASGLFMSVLLWLMIIRPQSQLNHFLNSGVWRENLVGLLGFTVLFGLLILSKANYWVSLIACVAYLPTRELVRSDWCQALKVSQRIAIPCLCGVIFAGVWYLALYHSPDRKARIAAGKEANATQKFKRATPPAERHIGLDWRARGIPLSEIVCKPDWYSGSARSLYGYYGYLRHRSSMGFYYLAWSFILIMAAFGVYGHFRKHRWRALWLIAFVLAVSVLNIALSVRYSWTVDYQPQGRYLFPGWRGRFAPRHRVAPHTGTCRPALGAGHQAPATDGPPGRR